MIIAMDIYNTVKPSLIKGALYKDIYYDIKATAWQYAYIKINHLPRLKKIADILKDNGQRNDLFMNHYTQALKTLRKTKAL
jgi:hypothetical protein